MTTDSKGRVLVAGTSRPVGADSTPGPPEFPGPAPAWATVTRFLSNGKRDTSFGNNGTIHTTLGVPPPEPHTSPSEPPFQYQTPAVAVTGLAVDPEDRPIVTGHYVVRVTRCYLVLSVGKHGSFVARLTTSGDADPSFNDGGPFLAPDIAEIRSPTQAPDGRIFYISTERTQCLRGAPAGPYALGALNREGRLDQGFGVDGYAAPNHAEPSEVAVDARGAIFVAVGVPLTDLLHGEEERLAFRVARLTPNGKLNRAFAAHGFADLPDWMSVSAIAPDRRGRILLAGLASRGRHGHSRLLIARLRRNGRLDRRFGRRGWITTGLGRRARAQATGVLVGRRGRILVAGVAFAPRPGNQSKVVLARYLSGR